MHRVIVINLVHLGGVGSFCLSIAINISFDVSETRAHDRKSFVRALLVCHTCITCSKQSVVVVDIFLAHGALRVWPERVANGEVAARHGIYTVTGLPIMLITSFFIDIKLKVAFK